MNFTLFVFQPNTREDSETTSSQICGGSVVRKKTATAKAISRQPARKTAMRSGMDV